MKNNFQEDKRDKNGIGSKYWKSRFAIEILAAKFRIHGYEDKISTTEMGPFVTVADIVLRAANRISKDNEKDESRINISAINVVKDVLKKAR